MKALMATAYLCIIGATLYFALGAGIKEYQAQRARAAIETQAERNDARLEIFKAASAEGANPADLVGFCKSIVNHAGTSTAAAGSHDEFLTRIADKCVGLSYARIAQ